MLRPDAYRLFLLGENAFVLDYEKLSVIFDMTDQYMPNIHEFAMYSRIDDIARKTDEELRFLHQMGLTTLHIGLESGSDSILLEQKKGVTSMDMERIFSKVAEAAFGVAAPKSHLQSGAFLFAWRQIDCVMGIDRSK